MKIDIDRKLFGFLLKSANDVKLDARTATYISETLWSAQELDAAVESTLKNRTAELLNIDDESNDIEQMEFHAALYNGFERLLKPIEAVRYKNALGAFAAISAKSEEVKGRRAAAIILCQQLNKSAFRNRVNAFCRLLQNCVQKKKCEDGLLMLHAVVQRQTTAAGLVAFRETRTYGRMRLLFRKKNDRSGSSKQQQDVQLLEHFDAKPRVYLSLLAEHDSSRQFLLLLKVLTDVFARYRRETYSRHLFEMLRDGGKRLQQFKLGVDKLQSAVSSLRLKSLGVSMLFLKHSKQTLQNFKFSLLLIYMLHHHKKRYYFKHFEHALLQQRRPADLAIATTKTLNFASKRQPNAKKLLMTMQKLYKHRLYATLTFLLVAQKPKQQSAKQNVVYGRVVALRAPQQSQTGGSMYRPSLYHLGSQDFDASQGWLSRLLRQRVHAAPVPADVRGCGLYGN